MSTIRSYQVSNQGNSSNSPKVYTLAEYESMYYAGTWTGGFVEGVGYVMMEIYVDGSYDSDFSIPDFSWDDPFGSILDYLGLGVDSNTTMSGGGSSGTTGGQGGGTGQSGNSNSHSSQATALSKILEFENDNSTNTVYPNISKAAFANALRNRINNPASINQGNLGTCGAAVICKFAAEFFPLEYVEASLSLYKTGEYSNWGLYVSENSKSGTDAMASQYNISTADAIIQGAIVNSANSRGNDYNPFTDGSGLKSFMWPGDIRSFFSDYLGCSASKLWLAGEATFNSLDYANNFVIALVHCNQNGKDLCFDRVISFKLHYLEVTGIRDSGGLNVWTWGASDFYSTTTDAYAIIVVSK